ncbi:chaperone protein DnaJ [Capsicum chacoense]|uniref:Protein EMBRYO SAC DEVELOPMENT ARREST 3, chloroplastic n=1 Tax=Capsicum annuum TaxID=4072 RepID=A0A1U8EYF1_CAPAN|nr:chaperone protein DnaJ [Capsicum annuum]KAF3643778.1 putative monogalactosyldiacylglycerol synthase, chloroplastic-like [Capsicum annuum]PHT64545.1 hypothetical protein T459_31613 [Capsicum annuum]
MSSSGSCTCSYRPIITAKSNIVVNPLLIIHGNRRLKKRIPRICVVRASTVENSSSNFVQRIEKAWLISKQPRPIICSTCDSNGNVDCKWCGGTGFFILGDNMLCQVPSRNTSCVICAGKGSVCCTDCKGTGHRAKWLGEPPIPKPPVAEE